MDNRAGAFIETGMERDTDIVIAGGGLNGASLALALASGGFRATVVEPRAPQVQTDPDFDGRSYALSLASQRLLKALGLWANLAGHAQPILDIKITDGRVGSPPSPFVLEFDHAEIDEGPMGYMVEDRFLRRALVEAQGASERIDSLHDVTVVTQAPDDTGIGVTLSDGRALRAGLLVGCDGKTSAVAARAGKAGSTRAERCGQGATR